MEYESTVIEVVDQYDLTDAQREAIMVEISAGPCPWNRRTIYMRTHVLAAQMEREGAGNV